jgi:hypothetical protein
MDFALLVSNAERENPNAPLTAIITKPVTSIGRHADIRMDTSTTHEISKQHAQISYKERHGTTTWIIEDLHSLNGTLVNSIKIHDRSLKHGDEIVFGAGSSFMYGDVLLSTDNADCRYLFVVPDPPLHFAARGNHRESLAPIESVDECCICYLPMVVHTQLPCGHTFCKSCIIGWRDRCARVSQQFVCPACRRICDTEEARVPSLVFENNNWFVLNVEPFLRLLNMLNVSEVRRLSLFERWNLQKKADFWEVYEKVKGHRKKIQIFRWLTNSTFRALKDGDHGELLNAVDNLEGNVALYGEELREHAIWLVATKLHQIEKCSTANQNIGWSGRPDLFD